MAYWTIFTTEPMGDPNRMTVSLDKSYSLGTLSGKAELCVGNTAMYNDLLFKCIHKHYYDDYCESTVCFLAPYNTCQNEAFKRYAIQWIFHEKKSDGDCVVFLDE